MTCPTGLNHPTLAVLACVGGGGLNAGAIELRRLLQHWLPRAGVWVLQGADGEARLQTEEESAGCFKELTGKPGYKLKKSQLNSAHEEAAMLEVIQVCV